MRRGTPLAALALWAGAALTGGAGRAAEPGKNGATAAVPVAAAGKVPGAKKRERERLRQDVLDQMRAERMWRLTEELRLDEATAAKVFPLLAKFDERAKEVGKERGEIAQALAAELDNPRPDDGRLKTLVDRLIVNRGRRQGVETDRIAALRQVLSPVQQAKLVLLLPKLEDGLRHRIRDTLDAAREAAAGRPTGRD
jgi:hypothetical protein